MYSAHSVSHIDGIVCVFTKHMKQSEMYRDCSFANVLQVFADVNYPLGYQILTCCTNNLIYTDTARVT